MCGIAGIIGSTNNREISIMLSAIKNRGNNKPHYAIIDNAIIGNVLLEILDCKNGQQPIFNNNKSISIVFNGEIYNYKSLRTDLESKGYVFKTKTDTEVILYLYEEYKYELLNKLDGMFAFLIYDKNEKSYFGARDHFGIKPFYYSICNNKFYFSSELKSFIHTNCTEFKELKPGHFIKNGKIKKWYFGLDNIKFNDTIKFETAKKKIKKLLADAVKKRVETTLPITIFFSGGIDSTIILNLAKKFHNNILALIVGHNDAEDTIHAIRYCKENNINYMQIDFSDEDLIQLIPEVIHRIETFEPNPVRGATLSYLLSKKANNLGYRIALCGEGADEIFAGYGDFLNIDNNWFLDYQIDLTKDLYRTQLLRVDRTAMGFELEVRVPYLDKKLVEFAISLPINYKINKIDNKITTKYILREAFKNDLPEYIYKRKKTTLMKGAGAGKVNRGSGIFYDFASKRISDEEFKNLRLKYPAHDLKDKEVAYYFKIFRDYYKNAKFAKKRTINALIEINGD